MSLLGFVAELPAQKEGITKNWLEKKINEIVSRTGITGRALMAPAFPLSSVPPLLRDFLPTIRSDPGARCCPLILLQMPDVQFSVS